MEKNNLNELKSLKENFKMYEKTAKETVEHLRERLNEDGTRQYTDEQINERVELIRQMQNDIVQKYSFYGGNISDLKGLSDYDNNALKTPEIKPVSYVSEPEEVYIPEPITPIEEETVPNLKEFNGNFFDPIKPIDIPKEEDDEEISLPKGNTAYDVIQLPSKGECYAGKKKTIAVSYLTANDENIIVSPNLYKDGLIIDYLLKEKIDKSIKPDDLLDGDREAIILWLRATGYGQEYPITVTDNKTGIDFDTVIDLSKIQYKPFTLKSDDEGLFDFEAPVSKDKIKFRFLTHRDTKLLKQIDDRENNEMRKAKLNNIVNELDSLIDSETSLDKTHKTKLYEAKREITKWKDGIQVDNAPKIAHTLTNKLEMSIVSVNGNRDRKFIAQYARNMRAKDSLELRKYILENEPGLDYNIEVERPESLGGGSMNVFLSMDNFIFLNLA